ncbi:covalently-linked cell wall protein [Diplocarpon rosae]|nr:covalently-linked cell wall protein [Diplocarpon rosae]
MHTTLTLAALASAVFALPHVARDAPAGCSTSYDGDFQITILNGSSIIKRDLSPRAASTCGQEGYLTATLEDGNLVDNKGRIGSIVSNRQFQFDGPPAQAGAVYSEGWSICSNGSLATPAGSTLFYSCRSGEFANLYDESVAEYCLPVYIDVLPCSSDSSGDVSEQADGQPTATTSVAAVTQISDGQPQGETTAPAITQIADGQLQGMPAVTQVADGQLQIPTGAPAAITQIGDGQVQAPTTAGAPAATQITDGQVQVPTTAAAPATQIGDGQVQVPTVAPTAGATQISDGQVQVPTSAPRPAVSQIPDGQLQSNVSTTATPSPIPVSAGSANIPLLAGTLASAVLGVAAAFFL